MACHANVNSEQVLARTFKDIPLLLLIEEEKPM